MLELHRAELSRELENLKAQVKALDQKRRHLSNNIQSQGDMIIIDTEPVDGESINPLEIATQKLIKRRQAMPLLPPKPKAWWERLRIWWELR